jgi:hypothetical protein
MSQIKDKYFELLVREEQTIKYRIRANDQDQAERIFEQHGDYYGGQDRQIVAQDKHIIEIGETDDGKPF